MLKRLAEDRTWDMNKLNILRGRFVPIYGMSVLDKNAVEIDHYTRGTLSHLNVAQIWPFTLIFGHERV
jgi:hypothetical protein